MSAACLGYQTNLLIPKHPNVCYFSSFPFQYRSVAPIMLPDKEVRSFKINVHMPSEIQFSF